MTSFPHRLRVLNEGSAFLQPQAVAS